MVTEIARFTGKRQHPTLHDTEELRGVIQEFMDAENPVAFAAAIVDGEGNFSTRFIVIPSGHRTDLFASLFILHRDLLEYCAENGEES